MDVVDADRVGDGKCAMASLGALLGSLKCTADVDEIADIERELPHTQSQ
jgi:hypothetical protein